MTTDTQPTGDRQLSPAADVRKVICSEKHEQQRGLPIDIRRIVGLDTAASLLGKGPLAEAMGISVRSLNYKANGERGIDDDDILFAVLEVEARAQRLLTHALKLRTVLSDSARASDWAWWAGQTAEWYANGPFRTRDQAIAALDGDGGHIVEARFADPVHFDAQQLIEAQYLESNDAFDYDAGEPDRKGPGDRIAAADSELQQLLDLWCAKWAGTFARGNMFAETRHKEQIAPEASGAGAQS